MEQRERIRIDFLAVEKESEGQGVHTASWEDISLMREAGKDAYEVSVRKGSKRADIVHCCDIHPQFYPFLRKGKVSLCMVHFLPDTLDGSISLPKGIFSLFKKYVMKFYSRADHLVTVNPVYRDRLIALGFAPERVHYVPNYVSSERFHPLPENRRIWARNSFNIEGDAFVVTTCGQTQPRKGIYDFVELAEANPDITFVWAGGFTFGPLTADHRRIERTIRNCPPNLRFPGIVPHDRMCDLYGASDIYLSTSYDELFPMTILEAASVGVPIVVRDLDLYEPILGDSVISCADTEQFSRIIRQLKDDPDMRAEWSARSSSISQTYSRENVYRQWDELYRSILASAPEVRER